MKSKMTLDKDKIAVACFYLFNAANIINFIDFKAKIVRFLRVSKSVHHQARLLMD